MTMSIPQTDRATKGHKTAALAVLTVVAVLALCTVAFADDSEAYVTVDKLEYTLDETAGTANVIGYDGKPTDIDIPGSILVEGKEYTVTSIGYGAFNNMSTLISVTMPSSITALGGSAFFKCTALETVVLSDALTAIEEETFKECLSLTSVDIPASVKSIGNSAFEKCKSLAIVVIPDATVSLDSNAFRECTSLSSICVGPGVKSIDNNAFTGCYNMFEVINLSTLNIVKGETSYGSIAANAMIVVDSEAKSTVQVDEDGFVYGKVDDRTYLLGYTGKAKNLVLPSDLDPNGYDIYRYALDETGIETLVIPACVGEIGEYALYKCQSLTDVQVLGATVIGDHVFRYCSAMVSISLPFGLEKIGKQAFFNCTSLKSIDIPEGVATISDGAFRLCKALLYISIPDSLTYVAADSFGTHTFYDGEAPLEVTAKNVAGHYFEGASIDRMILGTGFKMTFDANGGVCGTASARTGADGTLYALPDTANKDKEFLGWFTAPNGGTKVTESTVFTEDTTVYAHWPGLPTYTVTFNSNGGSPSGMTIVTGPDGKLPALPKSPSRDNYTFDGWYTKSTGGTKITTSTVFTEDTTVYAHWTEAGGHHSVLMYAIVAVLTLIVWLFH